MGLSDFTAFVFKSEVATKKSHKSATAYNFAEINNVRQPSRKAGLLKSKLSARKYANPVNIGNVKYHFRLNASWKAM